MERLGAPLNSDNRARVFLHLVRPSRGWTRRRTHVLRSNRYVVSGRDAVPRHDDRGR